MLRASRERRATSATPTNRARLRARSLACLEERARLRRRGFHAVIAGIALPNDPSVRLHEALGFRHVATFREVGWKFDRWIDAGFWQLEL